MTDIPNIGAIGVDPLTGGVQAPDEGPTPAGQPESIAKLVPAANDEGLRIMFSRLPGYTATNLGLPFYFQVPPLDEFGWSVGFTHTDYETVAAGSYSRPGGRTLATIDFNTMFVDFDPTWATHHYGAGGPPLDIQLWTRHLRLLCQKGMPFVMRAGTPAMWEHADIEDLPVTMRTLNVVERAGEVDTRYLSMQLVEYRKVTLKRKRRGLPATVKVYGNGIATYNSGDGERRIGTTKDHVDLADISKKFYGSPGKWRRIANANRGLENWRAGWSLDKWVAKHHAGPRHKTWGRYAVLRVPDLPGATSPTDKEWGVL